MKNEKDKDGGPPVRSRPEHGADSQLHNYNVMLSRLGDLFEDDEAAPASPVVRNVTPPHPK